MSRGGEVDTQTGYEAAWLVMLNCLGSLEAEMVTSDRVTRIVNVLGMVKFALRT